MSKFLLFSVVFCFLFVPNSDASRRRALMMQRKAAGGLASFSDDFNRGSLGANWTKITQSFGAIEIVSNVVKSENSFDTANRGAFYNATPLAVNQYVKLTLTSANNSSAFPGILLRVVDASSPCYVIEVREVDTIIQWGSLATPSSSISVIQSDGAFSFTYPITLGVTIDGTGNSTVVRIWRDPSANAPTSATSWDGGAADVEFTDNPGTAADSGTLVGLAGHGNADIYWDDIFAGTTP